MKPFIVVIFSYVFIGGSVIGALQTGSPPVSWKLYKKLSKTLTWNEAATFCRDRGGHLPVPDTHLSQSALKHWVNTWRENRKERVNIWSGLYKVPGTEFNLYKWERDGEQYDFCTTPIHFWDENIPEPNNVCSEMCVRLSSPDTFWKTYGCDNSWDMDVVCEFFEDCCTYSRYSDVTWTNTANKSYPEVTSLEDCWQMCDLYGEECVMAKWNRDSATCAEQTPVNMKTMSSSGEQTERFLQHCFGGQVSQEDRQSEPLATGSPKPAPQNFVCTLALSKSASSLTSNTETKPAKVVNAKPDIAYYDNYDLLCETTLGCTKDPDSTLTTSKPKTTSTTIGPKPTPATTESTTTLTTTEPKTTPTTTEPITTPTTTEPKIKPATTEPKTSPTTTEPKTTLTTTEPKTTPTTTEPKTTPTTTETKIKPATTEPKTTQADTFLSKTALPKTNPLEATMSDVTTITTVTGSSAERLASTPRTSISTTSFFTSKTDGAEIKCDYCHLCPCPLKCTDSTQASLESTPPAEATQTPSPLDLFVVQKNATSKYRRHRSSEWAAPSVSTYVISVTSITTTTAFVLFFVCCDVATLARCFGGKKSAAVKPDSKSGE